MKYNKINQHFKITNDNILQMTMNTCMWQMHLNNWTTNPQEELYADTYTNKRFNAPRMKRHDRHFDAV